jgi:hypothetical protein
MDTQRPVEPVALSWHIQTRPGAIVVEFHGEIDEHSDFGDLRARLHGPTIFDLGRVRRINSCGVREWVNFVRDLAATTQLTFVACSPAIVTQLNMIYNFRGPARIASFLAPYVCASCEAEEEKLLDVAAHFPDRSREPPGFKCSKCSGTLEFDDLPERYLAFLNDA